MNIKTELLKKYISYYINYHIDDFEIDADEITDTIAKTMLGEIQEILHHTEYSDFETVEEIVEVFAKYNIDTGGCHDF